VETTKKVKGMKTIRLILTIILLIYLFPAILSLHDVMLGSEPDLSTERIIVDTYLLLSFIYCIVNLLEFLKDFKTGKTT